MREIFALVGSITCEGLDKVQKGFNDLDKTLNKVVKPIDKLGRSVENVGKKLTVLTAPIVAAGAGVIALSKHTADYAEKLVKFEAMTGLSTDTLQEFDHVARNSGVNFEEFINTIAKLTFNMSGVIKEGGNVYNAFVKLGVQIKDSSGNIRNMNDLFPETIYALQKVENETERNSLAAQIFGRSTKDIAPILKMTRGELDAFRKAAHDNGLVLSNEALQAADQFGDEIQNLEAQFAAIVRTVGISFMPIIKDSFIPFLKDRAVPALQDFIGKIKSLVDWFHGLNPRVKDAVLSFAAFLAVSGPVLIAIGKFIGLAKTLSTTILAVRTAVLALNVALLANPISLTVLGIAALSGAIALAVVKYQDLQKEHEKFTAMTSGDAARKDFTGSFDALIKKMKGYGAALNEPAKLQELLGKDIDDLTEKARKLGYTVEGDLNARLERLNKIALESGGVRDLTTGLIKAGAAAAKLGKEVKQLTDEEKKQLEELAKKRAEYEKNWTEKLFLETASQLEILDYQEKQALKHAESTEAGRLAVQKYYKIQREKLHEEEAQKRKDFQAEMDTFFAESEMKAEKEKKERLDYNLQWSIKTIREQLRYELSAEMEKARSVGASEQTIFNIRKAYHDKEMALVRDGVSNQISQYGSFVNSAIGLFSMANDNQQIAIDNTYKKQKEAIENSTMDETAKQAALKKLDTETEKRRSAARRKQAILDKADAIFSIGINTAVAVVKALPNVILAGIIGGIGLVQEALVLARPIPMAEGGIAKARRGGYYANIAESGEDEGIIPLRTGIPAIADAIINNIRSATAGLPELAVAGSTYNSNYNRPVNIHVGTMIADEYGIKQLERRLYDARIAENERRG